MATLNLCAFVVFMCITVANMEVKSTGLQGGNITWTAWSKCNVPCPWTWCKYTSCIGARTRNRTCESNNHSCTGALRESVLCLTDTCALKGVWSDWTQWSACSETCGRGKSLRVRVCADHEHTCQGDSTEKVACYGNACAKDGTWAEWGECSLPCGGTRKRQRTCNDLEMRQGSKNCSEHIEETQHCNETNCEGKNEMDCSDEAC